MKKRFYIVTILGQLLLFSACSTPDSGNVGFPGKPVEVSTEKVVNQNIGIGISASGSLVSRDIVNISTNMMGFVTEVKVDVGQSVHPGTFLVGLNSDGLDAQQHQAQAGIAQAQADFIHAKKDYQRFQNLFAMQSASQKELDDARMGFDIAKANLKAARETKNEVAAHLQYLHITSPISGIITAKNVNPGDLTNPGMPLLTIESPEHLQAVVWVAERDIQAIQPGMKVVLNIASTGKQVEGTVANLSISSVNTGGQYQVKIDLPHESGFLPGMFVRAGFPVMASTSEATPIQGVVVPQSAITRQGQLQGLYVISNQNTAILRWVKTGKIFGDRIEVLSGLKPGESFIVSANSRLYNGVEIILKNKIHEKRISR